MYKANGGWIRRTFSAPLDAMYASIDETLTDLGDRSKSPEPRAATTVLPEQVIRPVGAHDSNRKSPRLHLRPLHHR